MDKSERILGVPFSLIEDDNRPLQIVLPPGLLELPLSSAPQYSLYRLIRHLRPKRILEIGTQIGASAVAMALAQRDNDDRVSVDCIDPFLPCGDNDGKSSLDTWFSNVSGSGYLATGIRLHLGLSGDILPTWSSKFDFIVVDGSHRYDDVKLDFELALNLISEGGHIWLHDYMIYESVRQACTEVAAKHQIPFAVNEIQANSRNEICGWALARKTIFPLSERLKDIGALKLHLGCGRDKLPGYINIDTDHASAADLVLDFTKIDQMFAPGSLDEVLMIHSLNYLRLWEARDLFRVIRKLLTSTGKLVIETPNVVQLIERIRTSAGNTSALLEGIRGFHAFGMDQIENREAFNPYAFSWTPEHLMSELHAAGFSDVQILAPQTHSAWRDMRVEAVGVRALRAQSNGRSAEGTSTTLERILPNTSFRQ
jgi:predicted O-methyltransferase YrrM